MSKAINKDRKTIILNLDKELDQSDYIYFNKYYLSVSNL